ncbi:MAG: dsRBD fold-containing protein [Mycobacterium sp.]|uniref:dsRBD fold-containing protein n=1 Tax=Mycobacterium sp. TaxID=1785 RepID=UPI003C5B2067
MHPSGPPALDPTSSTIRITVDESAGGTRARVELAWAGRNLAGTGVAYRHPSDYLNDHARQEMATARALSDLARQLAVHAAHARAASRLTVVR